MTVTYGALNHENVVKIFDRLRKNYLNCISKEKFPNGQPLHLQAFDETIGFD